MAFGACGAHAPIYPVTPSCLATLETKFGTLAEHTIAALAKSQTDARDERIWRAAIVKYGKLKAEAGGDHTENLVHFFAVDGIGLDERHPVVVTRVKASAARKKRWMTLLESACRRPRAPR